MRQSKGGLCPPKRMNFWRNSERGVGGHLRSKKNHCKSIADINGYFGNEFLEKFATFFPGRVKDRLEFLRKFIHFGGHRPPSLKC